METVKNLIARSQVMDAPGQSGWTGAPSAGHLRQELAKWVGKHPKRTLTERGHMRL